LFIYLYYRKLYSKLSIYDAFTFQGRRADIVKRARSEMVKQNQVKILDLAALWLEEELQEIGLEI
jgi:hypothetical protein